MIMNDVHVIVHYVHVYTHMSVAKYSLHMH